MDNNITKGDLGENLSAEFLKNKGYCILENKFRAKTGEIDIIARDGAYIVFVEVKLRTNLEKGYPREAVNIAKQRKIRRTAESYIRLHKLYNQDFRFDVIEILYMGTPEIIHIENAF